MGYRLLYVLNAWANQLTSRYDNTEANQRVRQLIRIVSGFLPHLAADLIDIPETAIRSGLEQVRDTLNAVLDDSP